MPPKGIRLGAAAPLLDIRSFARLGRQDRAQFRAQAQQIAWTVGRVPEVVVKASGGARSTRGVAAHLEYIDRDGELEIETDEGATLQGDKAAQELIAQWDLESQEILDRSPYVGKPGGKPKKLVHNVIFSMPKGTDPKKLLAATKALAREQFALKHRYGLVLHTDQKHPHVHMVIRAEGEQGQRLNIRKATLREWRREFARQLRAHGIAANATERAVRGRSGSSLKDSIYRPAARGESRHLQERVGRVYEELRSGGLKPTLGAAKLVETRRVIRQGWLDAADALAEVGQGRLAEQVRSFVVQMAPPRSTDEQLAATLLQQQRRVRQREQAPEYTR
jgi:hypothetical protein